MKISKIYKRIATTGLLISGVCLGVLNAEAGDNALADAFKAAGLETSGFVSISATQQSRDSQASSFELEQAELDFTAKAGSADLVLDIDFSDGGSGARGFTFNNGNTGEIEQGFIRLNDILTKGLTASIGKWNAPIGLEGYDAIHRDQWSLSYMFFNAIPANMTGLFLTYQPQGIKNLNFEAILSNGWDSNTETNATSGNTAKTWGGGVNYSPMDGIDISADYWEGSETTRATGVGRARGDKKRIFDTFVKVQLPQIKKGTWVAYEFLYGTEDEASVTRAGEDAAWTGQMVKFHYPLQSKSDEETLGLTARFEVFDDKDGYIIAANPVKINNVGENTVWATTAALNFVVPDTEGSVVGFLEIRHDEAKHNAFTKNRGGARNSADNDTLALNLIYKF
jgi:hypothetical protein